MPLEPLDPLAFPITPEERQASKVKAAQRQIDHLYRSSLNVPGKQAVAELDANRAAAWQSSVLQNGAANVGGVKPPAAYYKDTFGRVYTRGFISIPEGFPYDGVLWNYGVGYRPAYEEEFSLIASSGFEGGTIWASVTVKLSGDVTLQYGGSIENVPLSVIEFRTF